MADEVRYTTFPPLPPSSLWFFLTLSPFRPNMVMSKLPPDWIIHSDGLSMSDPLPLASNGVNEEGHSDSKKTASPTIPSKSAALDQGRTVRGAPPPPRRVFLRSYHGAYLTASPEGKVFCVAPRLEGPEGPAVPHIAEIWDMEFDRYGAAFLRSAYGHYLSAQNTQSVSSVHLAADRDFPGPDGRETFFPLLDDRQHTLGLITCTGHYVYADPQHRLVGAPTVPPLSPVSEAPSENEDSALKSSVEFYRLMSKFVLHIAEPSLNFIVLAPKLTIRISVHR